MDLDVDELCWLGAAVISSQKLEFALYGIVAHLSHTDVAKTDKRFRDLNPEKFLRGDIEDLKATLGTLVKKFGDVLLIKSDLFDDYVANRNMIVHNYWRVTRTKYRDEKYRIEDRIVFLRTFAEQTDTVSRIVQGCIAHLKIAAAIKENRSDELLITEFEKNCMNEYEYHAGLYLKGINKI